MPKVDHQPPLSTVHPWMQVAPISSLSSFSWRLTHCQATLIRSLWVKCGELAERRPETSKGGTAFCREVQIAESSTQFSPLLSSWPLRPSQKAAEETEHSATKRIISENTTAATHPVTTKALPAPKRNMHKRCSNKNNNMEPVTQAQHKDHHRSCGFKKALHRLENDPVGEDVGQKLATSKISIICFVAPSELQTTAVCASATHNQFQNNFVYICICYEMPN